MKYCNILTLLFFTILQSQCTLDQVFDIETDVLVIGGGASGTMAGIQAARMGVNTVIVEETPWLGGMLTSAGVSAIDGNYRLHSGLWEEFRQNLYDHYGDPDSVKTGWVSNVLFEPHVGAEILEEMTKGERALTVYKESRLSAISKIDKGWEATIHTPEEIFKVKARIVIDATELGDVAKQVGIPYDIGMDSRDDFGEDMVSVRPLPYSILSTIESAAVIIELPSFDDAYYVEDLKSEIANTLYQGFYNYEEEEKG